MLSLTISAVAGPTVPRIGAANVRVGASGSCAFTMAAPLMAWTASSGGASGLPLRRVIASTKAFSPALRTRFANPAGSTPTRVARARADATASP